MKFDFSTIGCEKQKEIGKLKERRSLISAIQAAGKTGITPIIAEVKKASPSLGDIRELDAADAAREMEEGGACAISVLTDAHFKGEIGFLRQVKNGVSLPVLRKDFMVDEFQLLESRGNGADAVLLIADLLKSETGDFVEATHEMGLEALVEVHAKENLCYALESKATLIGINNRDLKTLKVDLSTTKKLVGEIPDDRIVVCESGINNRTEIESMLSLGVDAFLVGTAITSSEDITKKVRELAGK